MGALRAKGSSEAGRFAAAGWRLKVLVLVALLALGLGLTAAYAALGSQDTATGTGALASENGGFNNTADGYSALGANTTGAANTAIGRVALEFNTDGSVNTAVGSGALAFNISGSGNTAVGQTALISATGGGNTAVGLQAGGSSHPLTSGNDDTFIGAAAGPGIDSEIDHATAVGANAVVSQSDSLVLGAPGVNVGVNTATPQSRLQVGSGATSTFGEYMQIPVVTSTANTPPASDCNSTNLVGRLVLLGTGKKIKLWACSPAGLWVKL